MSTIALSLNFANFDKEKYEKYPVSEAIERMYEDKMIFLQNYDTKTLIVIDNYNVDADDEFHRFTSGNYKVIFTSREKHDENVILVESMEENQDLLALFRKYHDDEDTKLLTDDEPMVLNIIQLVLGHTMTVMLIAAAMRVNGITPSDMYARLKNSLNPDLERLIGVDKEEISAKVRNQVMYQHVLNLFDMERFSINDDENEAFTGIMTNMAIVPFDGLEIDELCSWAFAERNEDVVFDDFMKLVKLRWVQYDEDSKQVSLHPVISEVAADKLKPDSENCSGLLEAYTQLEEVSSGRTYVEQLNYCINTLELSYKRINDVTLLTARLLYTFGYSNLTMVNCQIALECYNKLISLLIELIEKTHDEGGLILYKCFLLDAYGHKGNACEEMRAFDEAITAISKAIEIGEYLHSVSKNTGLDMRVELAKAYQNRGVVYEYMKRHNDALLDKNKSIALLEQVIKDEISDAEDSLANAYMNRASTYDKLDRFDEGQTDTEKSIEIWERMKAEGKKINESGYLKAKANRSYGKFRIFSEKSKKRLSNEGASIEARAMRNTMLEYRKKQLNGGNK